MFWTYKNTHISMRGWQWGHQRGKAIQASTQQLRPRLKFQVRSPVEVVWQALSHSFQKNHLHSQESFTSVPALHLDYSCTLETAQRWLCSSAGWAISAKKLSFQLLPWPQPFTCPSLTLPLTPYHHPQNKEPPQRLWLPDLVPLHPSMFSGQLSGRL